MASKLELGSIFQSVTEQLAQNKDSLNAADSYNHNHGDHMVQIFNLVQNASQVVGQNADSGSATLYAQGFAKAAENMRGKELSPSAMSALLTGLLGADKPTPTTQTSQKKSLFGTLLSSLFGRQTSSQADQGFGLDDLLQAGMAIYQSQQDSGNSTQSALEALLSASPMGQSDHRKESGSIVASTIMNFVKSLNK